MTLKEKLDARVKEGSPEELKEEIEELFLKAHPEVLKRGLNIVIYYGKPTQTFIGMQEGICYFLENASKGQRFKKNYDENTVKEVIPLMKKEGIEVKDQEYCGRVWMSYVPLG